MQMTCADDVHMTPGVVLHEIGQLRQEEAILNSSAYSLPADLLHIGQI